MKVPPFYDAVGGAVTLILVVAVVVYPVFGVECPQIISSGFAVAMGWTFRGAVAIQNGVQNRLRSAPNGAASTTGSPRPAP